MLNPLKTLLVYMPMSFNSISTRVFKSFIDLVCYENQVMLREKYGLQVKTLISGTFPLDRNRNEAVDLAISSRFDASYILFVDGDQILPKNAVFELLDAITDHFPIVSGLYWHKTPPYTCVQGKYTGWKSHELQRKTIESIGFIDKDGNQCLFYSPLEDFDTAQPIDVAGMGCLLVKTDVFKQLDLPYFGYFNSYSLGGDFTIDHASEEMLFFCKLRKAGIKTLLVPSVRCGHEVTRVIGCPETN